MRVPLVLIRVFSFPYLCVAFCVVYSAVPKISLDTIEFNLKGAHACLVLHSTFLLYIGVFILASFLLM